MVLPRGLARINKRVTNPLLRHLVGFGPFAELEHTGRTSGRTFRTTLLAFRHGNAITLALTYGRDVDWLKNLRAAGGGRMRLGRDLLTLGHPVEISTAAGLARMPAAARALLSRAGVHAFVELPVLSERHRH